MKPVKRFAGLAIAAFFAITLISSCSDKSGRNAADSLSALVQKNDKIVVFGHISIRQLLDKLDYKHLPKINVLIGGELPSYEQAVHLDHPVYMAMQAPFDDEGNPEAIYTIADVNNKDSLVDRLNASGYTMESSGDMDFHQENEITFGVRKNLLIVLWKRGKYDGKAAIKQAFDDTKGDLSTGKTARIIASKGDIVTGVSLERLYATSNTSLSKLDESKKQEINDLLKDGYLKFAANFEKGKAVFKADNLFSGKLKDRLFFREDSQASVIKKLGTGNAWLGVSANLDIHKMEDFIADFAPEFKEEMNTTIAMQSGLMGGAVNGDNSLSKLFSGQIGFVAIGNPKSSGGLIPQFNFFLGTGSQGDMVNRMAEFYAGISGMTKKGSHYETSGMAIEPKDDGIYGYTVGNAAGSNLKIPGFAYDFGKKSLTLFVDFSQMDVRSFELEDGFETLEIMESLMVVADKDGCTATFVCKDKSTNVLNQVGRFYSNKLEESLAGF